MFLGIQWNHALIKQPTETESFVLHSLICLITVVKNNSHLNKFVSQFISFENENWLIPVIIQY